MERYEIADPVPLALFYTDAVVIQVYHCPNFTLFMRADVGGTFDCQVRSDSSGKLIIFDFT